MRLLKDALQSSEPSEDEIHIARSRKVDPHFMPDVMPATRVMGGMSSRGRHRLVSARMQCHGGAPKNVMYVGPRNGIAAECGSCGTSVYWEPRLKIWST